MRTLDRRDALAGLAAGLLVPSTNLSTRAAPPQKGLPPLPLTGVNLAGAEFGKMPGAHGRDYIYPNKENAKYYADLGFNVIRLPFKWERLQPDLDAPFEPGDETRLTKSVQDFLNLGLTVVLDPHNFAKRRVKNDGWAKEHLIGSDAVPASAFARFWNDLAARYADNERVVFGLMNEPADISVDEWLAIANDAIAAIRRTAARNLILVPGVAYTGAHSWFASGNTRMADVEDPAANFAFEVHQYFDRDSSGRSADAVSETIGSKRIRPFQDWARKLGAKAFLGEFCGGRNDRSAHALHDICSEMAANPDVWMGWTAWAGGPWWPKDDIFNLEPTQHGIREQTRILAEYAQRP